MAQRFERSGIQLAEPVTSRRLLTIGIEGKTFAQPKLNGERCRVQWFYGEPYLISSYGNEFQFCDKIKLNIANQVKRLNLTHLQFDGEIYKHGWSRERIHSAISRKKNYNPDVEELEFHIFDIKDTSSLQYARAKYLMDLREMDFFNDRLLYVPMETIEIENWMYKTEEYIQQGYEGIILRNPMAAYETKRIKGMLKFKPTFKDEYLIVGFKEGTGWAEGMLGSFKVKGNDGTEFDVGTGPELTKDKRIRYWAMRNQLLGKTLIVKHEEIKTKGGIPLCTVAYELKL